MKIIVANKDDYIKFNAMVSNEMDTFELVDGTTDYIIHRVELGNKTKDVSLMDSCINNLLDKQYEKREYIKLEDIQAINELICGLSKEECQILNAYAEVKKFNIKNLDEIKEFITNINDYQILQAYNLHEVGILIARKEASYHMDINIIPFVNFTELAERYLFDANIKGDFCSYGLLVNTRDMLDNELIQPKIDKDKMFKIEVVNKEEFKESQMCSRVIIYLPTSKEILKEKFQKINLDYDKLTIKDTHVVKCEIINFYNENLSHEFNEMMKEKIEKFETDAYSISFQEIELLSKEVKKFDNIKMKKFLALVYVQKDQINDMNDLLNCAKATKNYELLPEVKNLTDMGRYLVEETGYFNDVSFLEDYIDYYKLARDYTQKGCTYSGSFTEHGYLIRKELEENISKEEQEEDEF